MAKFLTSSPEEKDISTALDEVLADWAEPVLAGIRLSVNRQDVQAAGREALTTEARESPDSRDPAKRGLIDLGDLPEQELSYIIYPMVNYNRLAISFNNKYLGDANLVGVYPTSEYRIMSFVYSILSSMTMIFWELYGISNLGEGAIKLNPI